MMYPPSWGPGWGIGGGYGGYGGVGTTYGGTGVGYPPVPVAPTTSTPITPTEHFAGEAHHAEGENNGIGIGLASAGLGGVAIGAAVGLACGGPFGAAIGGLIGGIAGGVTGYFAGKSLGGVVSTYQDATDNGKVDGGLGGTLHA